MIERKRENERERERKKPEEAFERREKVIVETVCTRSTYVGVPYQPSVCIRKSEGLDLFTHTDGQMSS